MAFLVVAATLLVAGAATYLGDMTGLDIARQRAERVDTAARLGEIRNAVLRYAGRNRRLPCPAVASAALDSLAGKREVGLVDGRRCALPLDPATGEPDPSQGAVPWATLGLKAELALDEWGRRIVYRPFEGSAATTYTDSFVQDGGLDFMSCIRELAGTARVRKCQQADRLPDFGALRKQALAGTLDLAGVVADDRTAYQALLQGLQSGITGGADPLGLRVVAAGGAVRDATFVLISHGENGLGAWLPSGRRYRLPASEDERANLDGGADATVPGFKAVGFRRIDGAGAFDDLVESVRVVDAAARLNLWPTLERFVPTEWVDSNGDGTPDFFEYLAYDAASLGECKDKSDDFLVKYEFDGDGDLKSTKGDPSTVGFTVTARDTKGKVMGLTWQTEGYVGMVRYQVEGDKERDIGTRGAIDSAADLDGEEIEKLAFCRFDLVSDAPDCRDKDDDFLVKYEFDGDGNLKTPKGDPTAVEFTVTARDEDDRVTVLDWDADDEVGLVRLKAEGNDGKLRLRRTAGTIDAAADLDSDYVKKLTFCDEPEFG